MRMKKLWFNLNIERFIERNGMFYLQTFCIIFVGTLGILSYFIFITHVANNDTNSKVVTITGFQEPLMQGYSFLDTSDKKLLSSLGSHKVDIRQDLGVKATITTYRDNETHTVEIADVWMWRMVQ